MPRIKLIRGKLFPDRHLLQFDPWQVVPRQVFTTYDFLLISVALVVLCLVGCLWVTGVKMRIPAVEIANSVDSYGSSLLPSRNSPYDIAVMIPVLNILQT